MQHSKVLSFFENESDWFLFEQRQPEKAKAKGLFEGDKMGCCARGAMKNL